MAGTGQGYDLSATTYSPDGRIFQIDYAQKCCDNAPTCLAICCKDGIILATQKPKLSKMLVHGTNKRAYAINRTAGCCFTGLIPDGRNVMNRAREEATSYKGGYGHVIPGYMLAERIGSYMHQHTLYYSVRPIGTAILIGAVDEKKKMSLFSIDPSGHVQKWIGRAVGKGRQLGNTEIEKLDLKTLTCKDSLFHIARFFQKVAEEGKDFELEANWICEESGWQHALVPTNYIEEAQEKAKKSIEDEDDD